MEKNNTKLKLINSVLVFIFLLLIKDYLFYILNININNLEGIINIVFKSLYIIISLLVSTLFYLELCKEKNLKGFLGGFWKGVGVVSAYFILNELQLLPIALSGINYETIPLTLKVIYLLSYEVLLISIICLILNKEIRTAIQDIKQNHIKYFGKYFKYWLYALIIMFTTNLIINQISGGQIAGNEETIRNMFSQAPIYIFISSVFLAPVLEELVFRQGFRKIFSNDIVFIIISGLVFGGLHVVGNLNEWYDILYLIPYCTPGFIFAYILTKTNNIFVPMGIHFLHNGIIMSLQVLLLVLGQI